MKKSKLIAKILGTALVFVLIGTMLGSLPALINKVEASLATEIWDWYDLDAIRSNLGADYILMDDLDSATAGYADLASSTANGAQGWQPIGTFSGSFDGQRHEIRDLFINRHSWGSSGAGLFGVLSEAAVIKNVGVVNVTVTGFNLVGALAGYKNGIVSNCYATGMVSAEEDIVGGLVGLSAGTSGVVTMSNCYFIGSVSGDENVGGLVGATYTSLVGNSHSAGTVTGNWMVGGLVGDCAGWGVTNCYSTSNVTGGQCVGGLAGRMVGSTVTNCYATGTVTGGDSVGGLVGYVMFGSVSNSYSTGGVSGSSNIGGLVGQNGDTVSNSFWDTQTSGQPTSAAGIGKTTDEMKNITTFKDAGWDIKMTTLGNPTGGYPFLSWQLSGSSIWLITEEIPAGCVATATDTGIACFTTSHGTIEDLEALPAIPLGAPAGITFPHGMFSFSITGLELGQEVTIPVELPEPVPVGTKWWKYQSGSWYSLPIGDDDGDNIITVTLKDGDPSQGDADSIDGQITDPGGPGSPGAVGWESYPINKARVLVPWIALLAAVIAGAGLLALRRRRGTHHHGPI